MKSKRAVRTLKRHIAHEAIEQARQQSHSGWARRDRRRRQHLMEGSFADATNRHGFKRARWRGQHNQQVQDLLIAACQNIRILIGHERRRQAAAMAVAHLTSANTGIQAVFKPVNVIPQRHKVQWEKMLLCVQKLLMVQTGRADHFCPWLGNSPEPGGALHIKSKPVTPEGCNANSQG